MCGKWLGVRCLIFVIGWVVMGSMWFVISCVRLVGWLCVVMLVRDCMIWWVLFLIVILFFVKLSLVVV